MIVDPVQAAASPLAQTARLAEPSVVASPTSETAAPTMRADLFDYVMQQNPGAVGFNALTPAEQGSRLANPATLGDRILSGLDGFGQRAKEIGQTVRSMEQPAAASGTGTTLASGPAAGPIGADAQDGTFRQTIVTVGDIFNFAIETQVVERAANQATSSVNTLVKGQ